MFALSRLLPTIRETLSGANSMFGNQDLSALWWAGLIVTIVNAGTIFAYTLVKRADTWGRRRVLTVTIIGYTLFTLATGFSTNIWWFVGLQFFARIFLIAEWATSMVIAAEEFPATRRGFVIGVIQTMAALGSIVCAGVAPFLLATEYGWRSVYFVGVIPLFIMMFARRTLKETKRFQAVIDKGEDKKGSFFDIWRSPYRKHLAQLCLIWAVAYIPAQTGVNFWVEFVKAERGFSEKDVSLAMTLAALISMPMLFGSGKFIDLVGRRKGGAAIFLLGAAGIFGSYTLHGMVPLTIALTFGIFAASAFLMVLNAYCSELFPTRFRGDAFAWSNNIVGRFTYVLAPLAVSLIANVSGQWGPVVSATSLFFVIAAALVFFLLPETTGRELEETAQSS